MAKKKPKKKAKKKSKPKSSSSKTGSFAKLRSQIAKREGISYKDALSLAKKEYAEAKEEAAAQDSQKRSKRIEKFIKKYEGKGLRKDVVDAEKDAKQPALPEGKRTSKNGKIYYEYRDNRTDQRQPQPSDYPRLNRGGDVAAAEIIYPTEIIKGLMAKGGNIPVFVVSGYYKDDKSEFSNYLISEFDEDEVPKGFDDDDIFYYGMSEKELKNSSENDGNDFVITEYKRLKSYAKGGITKGQTLAENFNMKDEVQNVEFWKNDVIVKDKQGKVKRIDLDKGERISLNAKGGEVSTQTITIKFKNNSDALSGKQLLEDYYIDFGEIDNYGDELDIVATNPSFQYLEYIRAALEGKQEKIEVSSYAKGGKLSDKKMKRGASKEYYGYFRGYRPNTTQYMLLDDNYAAIVTKYRDSDSIDDYDIYDDKFQFRGSASGIKQGESGKQKVSLRKADFEKAKSFKDLYTNKKRDMSMAMMRAKGGNITHD